MGQDSAAASEGHYDALRYLCTIRASAWVGVYAVKYPEDFNQRLDSM